MKTVFNPITPPFDKVVSSESDISDIATTYLKLDCSNDPLTNTLDGANLDFTGTGNIDGILSCNDKVEYTDTTEYIDQESW